jgi:hypothetical protein
MQKYCNVLNPIQSLIQPLLEPMKDNKGFNITSTLKKHFLELRKIKLTKTIFNNHRKRNIGETIRQLSWQKNGPDNVKRNEVRDTGQKTVGVW